MSNTLYITNIKCNWCAKTITSELEKLWISNINISFEKEDSPKKRRVSFDWDVDIVREKLSQLWYPEYGTLESKNIIKKLKSFVSCAIWKFWN
jgi:copper chaperone CopZ